MSVVSHRIMGERGRLDSRVLRRAVRTLPIALLLVLACGGCFAIGRAGRTAEQSGPPPWAPAQALPSTTIAGGVQAPTSIPDLPAAAAKPALKRAATATGSSGTALAAASVPGAVGSTTLGGQTGATETTAPSTQAAPVSSSPAVSPGSAPASKPAAPSSSGGAEGGSSSGSFDSSE